jgi:hypothetical protein
MTALNSTSIRKLSQLTSLLGVASLAILSGCSPAKPAATDAPIVTSASVSLVSDTRPSVAALLSAKTGTPMPATSPATTSEVKVTAVVDKQALLSQQFLYGADLQYSSLYDKGMDLYQQSLSIGHVPASFRIVGNELQLIADNTRLYPSEVNHPEQLISRYKILSQTARTLTISGADSRVYLAEIFGGATNPAATGVTDPTARPARDLWIRSFDFVPKGNYLLQQTSVVLDDGTVAEFMESVFPRATLTPGARFQQFEMNPDNPAGGDDAPFDRFRFLPGETIFKGEHKFAMSEHYDLSPTPANPTGDIDWYVTPNITDEELAPVKLAVEGWNRYFTKMKGIDREVVHFKGRLPKGVYLGDPRYNVINWDSRLIAGAAYESQAVDPSTGKMSHSLIYMPAAWFQIGYKYWTNGQYSAEPAVQSVAPAQLAQSGGAMLKARIACLRDSRAAGALLAANRLGLAAGQGTDGKSDEPSAVVKEFGTRLLKDTLFHEVGHALGLAHNFKGSLTFDRKDPKSMFSSSIMDYNDYEIELAAFTATDSSDGPLLEYDRQAIDTIYNKGADLSDKDPLQQVCNDAESDSADLGGVDPVCIRYDIEKDPTLSVNTALDRINLATLPGDVTMAQSIARVPGVVLTPAALAAAKDMDAFTQLAADAASALKGSMVYYLTGGKASLAKTLRLNLRSLYKFEDGVLDDQYDEQAMRERVFAGVQKALALKAIPDAPAAALAQAEKDIVAALATTPFVKGLSADDSQALSAKLVSAVHKVASSVETDSTSGLPGVRATVLAGLARTPAPFFLGTFPGSNKPMNIEASVVGMLADAVTGADHADRSLIERVNATKALLTFKGRLQGDPAIAACRTAMTQARAAATDTDSLEIAQALLELLSK